ncbi:ABC transporter ATP-binding protein [Lachnospiraceae bacterium ZAX-1]
MKSSNYYQHLKENKMSAVELLNVTKKFGARTILNAVSFSVAEGELVALVGPSGCGKSTILNMIGLLETCDSGEIRIFGEKIPKIESKNATKLRRCVVNYLFQSFALIGDMTVEQNLLLSMRFLDIQEKAKHNRINKILDEVNLRQLKDATVNTMSGGEQQRVALARAVLKPGALILADEPTGSLDANAAGNAFMLIQELCRHYKKTVIMVTHSPELAQKADRTVDMLELG